VQDEELPEQGAGRPHHCFALAADSQDTYGLERHHARDSGEGGRLDSVRTRPALQLDRGLGGTRSHAHLEGVVVAGPFLPQVASRAGSDREDLRGIGKRPSALLAFLAARCVDAVSSPA
jgi:hypothetical protein